MTPDISKAVAMTRQHLVCSPTGEPTVYETLPPGFPAVPLVGRLDRETEGLQLFTEDGALAHALISADRLPPPGAQKVRKVYHVLVEGLADAAAEGNDEKSGAESPQLQLMRTPIEIDGRDTLPAQVQRVQRPSSIVQDEGADIEGQQAQWLEVTICGARSPPVCLIPLTSSPPVMSGLPPWLKGGRWAGRGAEPAGSTFVLALFAARGPARSASDWWRAATRHATARRCTRALRNGAVPGLF
eukprot:SAG11_NODE_1743_length_4335_cov_1.760387_2_plen_243_part_00